MHIKLKFKRKIVIKLTCIFMILRVYFVCLTKYKWWRRSLHKLTHNEIWINLTRLHRWVMLNWFLQSWWWNVYNMALPISQMMWQPFMIQPILRCRKSEFSHFQNHLANTKLTWSTEWGLNIMFQKLHENNVSNNFMKNYNLPSSIKHHMAIG